MFLDKLRVMFVVSPSLISMAEHVMLCRWLEKAGAEAFLWGALPFESYKKVSSVINKIYKYSQRLLWASWPLSYASKVFEKTLVRKKPDVVFTGLALPGLTSACKKMGVKIVFYDGDMMFHDRNYVELARSCEFIFTAYAGAVPGWRCLGVTKVYYLPFFIDPEIHKKSRARSSKKFIAAFIGNYYRAKTRGYHDILYPAANFLGRKLFLAGHGWKNQPNVAMATVHGIIPWRLIPSVLNASYIGLNVHRDSWRNIELALNQRTFETLGSGILLIQDPILGIEKLFEPKKDLIISNDPKETIDLIKYYLDNDEERERIADNGYNKVHRYHTARERAQEVLEKLISL